jgi:hypothetical protein
VYVDPRISTRVARRFQAELLTTEWLAGVRKGWERLTQPRIETWEDVSKAFDDLIAFIQNLRDQVFFVRRAPATLDSGIKVQFDRITVALKSCRSTAKSWMEVATGQRDYLGDNRSEGERMFDLYRSKFGALLTTRFKAPKAPSGTREGEITELVEKLLADLRADARKIDKSMQLDPQGTEEMWGQPAFKEFDLHGMKIVVDDATVSAKQIKQYIRLLDLAYESLKARRLQSAWYGVLLIQCENCGGENPWSNNGVGGSYTHLADVVRIYSRPSMHVARLVVHELGHRYWFKAMNSEQRARFEGLVRAPERLKGRPKEPISNRILRLYRDCKSLVKGVADFRLPDMTPEEAKTRYHGVIGHYVAMIQGHLSAFKKYTPEEGLKTLAEDVDKLAELANSYSRFEDVIRKTKRPWAEALQGWADAVEAYARRIANEAQKFDITDTSRVAPVSDYGESNIREAFAEAFLHYVMEYDMSQDQIESFRSVLSSENPTARLVARYRAAT